VTTHSQYGVLVCLFTGTVMARRRPRPTHRTLKMTNCHSRWRHGPQLAVRKVRRKLPMFDRWLQKWRQVNEPLAVRSGIRPCYCGCVVSFVVKFVVKWLCYEPSFFARHCICHLRTYLNCKLLFEIVTENVFTWAQRLLANKFFCRRFKLILGGKTKNRSCELNYRYFRIMSLAIKV